MQTEHDYPPAYGTLTAERRAAPRAYAVEVCWPRAGSITCRTYVVSAPSDEEASAKGRALARRHLGLTTRLEVVDLARLPEREAPLRTEATR
jgi:hypothetical protein